MASLALIFISLIMNGECRIFEDKIMIYFNIRNGVATSLVDRGFGFLPQGSVSFQAECPAEAENFTGIDMKENKKYLLFCSTADSRQFARMDTNQLTFDCIQTAEGVRTDQFCRRKEIVRNKTHFSFSQDMDFNYFYKFVVVQCFTGKIQEPSNGKVLECRSHLTLLNPDGEHLSSDEIPMPLIYYIFVFVWIFLTLTWAINFLIYHRFSNKLHKMLSIAPVGKTMLVIIVLMNWRLISRTGTESKPEVSLHYLLQSVCDAYLFILMIIIAEGYSILHTKLAHFRWTSLLLMFCVYTSSLVCVYWVHNYFLAFSVCCVVFMMYKTLKWCSYNIEFLYRRRRKLHHFVHRCNLHYTGGVTLEEQLTAKLEMFTRFRVLCAAFSMIYAIVVTLATFLTEYTYIQAVTYEIPQLIIYASIGFVFRLRNFTPFETIEVVVPKENCVAIFLPDASGRYMDPNVTLGIPLPTPPRTSCSPGGGGGTSSSPASSPQAPTSSRFRPRRHRPHVYHHHPLVNRGERRGVFTRHLLMYTQHL